MTESQTSTVRSDATGREIRATVMDDLEALALGILREFEKYADEWRDGFAIQLGWGPFALREDDGAFIVTSPDYSADPRTDQTDDITLAVWIMVSLLAAPRSAGVEEAHIAWDDDVICVRGWEQQERLQLSRIETTTPKDSGWFIDRLPSMKAGEYAPADLVRVPAWGILQKRDAAARALALPTTVKAIVVGDRIQTIVRASDSEILTSEAL